MEQNGTLMWTESAADSNVTEDDLPYTAFGVSHSPDNGKYDGGQFNNNDIVVWSTSGDNGVANAGYTRAFQLPPIFDPQLVQVLATVRLRTVRWSAVARPAISSNGEGLIFGVRDAQVRGWVRQNLFTDLANWNQQLRRNDQARGTRKEP